MSARLTNEDFLVKYCDREPIHCPGSVQTRGVLFACPDPGWKVTHVSDNAGSVLGVPARDVIGQHLEGVLGSALTNRLAALLPHLPTVNIVPARLFGVDLPSGGQANVSVHIYEGRRVVEVEPLAAPLADAPVDLVRMLLPSLQQARTINDLCQKAVTRLRGLIGYDRVMIYKFLPDGCGQVIAEDCDDDMDPYLNLRYPASDIPPQARELYRKNWVRLISDVGAQQVPIWAEDKPNLAALDLSFADLRSVSPIHIQYLKNMGVGASMSISIIVEGALWGLIACHHRTARDVPANLRTAAELFGQMFSLQIQSVEGVEAYLTLRAARATLDRIVAVFPAGGDVAGLADHLEPLAAMIPCDGAGLLVDGVWRGIGVLPSDKEAFALARELNETRIDGILATHRLNDLHVPSVMWDSGVKGLMAVSLSARGDWLFFFREELAGTVTWGGDPRKVVAFDDTGTRLLPRMSFSAWTETVRGQSRTFTSRERLIAEAIRISLGDVIVRFADAMAEAKREAGLKQRLMVSEHNKQVRGTLDLIRSLVGPAPAGDGAVGSYVRALDQRIRAITLAHNASSAPAGCELAALVEASLGDWVCDDRRLVGISGPRVMLDAKAYMVLAVVLNELVSLSSSSGALAETQGRLMVGWIIDNADGVMIEWAETCAVPPPPPDANCFGLTLVRQNVVQLLGGDAHICFDEGGLQARFVLPQRYVLRDPRGDEGRTLIAADDALERVLEGFAVLVVEDNRVAADQLELQLRKRGALVVLRANTAAAALELIARGEPDVAVLDIDLGTGTSMPVADMLSALNIPFLFADDGAGRTPVPARFADVTVVSKPYCGVMVPMLLQEALLPLMMRAVLGGDAGQSGT